MKVIDLLVKIANEDEIPGKIKYENYIYWYDKDWKDYKNAQVEFRSYLINSKYHNTDFLNDEVEIIEDTPEENKKIQPIREPVWAIDNSILKSKINEIIDKINGE